MADIIGAVAMAVGAAAMAVGVAVDEDLARTGRVMAAAGIPATEYRITAGFCGLFQAGPGAIASRPTAAIRST